MKKISDYKLNFQLFTFFINDISNYFEKRLVLKKIPQSIKILDDIKKEKITLIIFQFDLLMIIYRDNISFRIFSLLLLNISLLLII